MVNLSTSSQPTNHPSGNYDFSNQFPFLDDTKRESDLRLIAELLREDYAFRILCVIDSVATVAHCRT